jgi:biopolymer transport protein ExbB
MSHISKSLCFIAYFCTLTCSWTQSIDHLSKLQQTRLEAATERLKALRQDIRDQQIPLGKALTDLQKEANSLRRQLDEHRQLRDSNGLRLDQLESQVLAEGKKLNYITTTLFNEFESSFKAVLSPGETATFGADLRQLDLLLERSNAPEEEKLSASLSALHSSVDRIGNLVGGKRYPGTALDPEGTQLSGSFLQIGPILYFVSSSNEMVGWVIETKSLHPKVQPLDSPEAEAIRELEKAGKGLVPIDPTLGDAVAIAKTRDSWQEHLRKGGIWVVPIIGFAILSMVIATYKCIQVFVIRQPQPKVVHQIIDLLGSDNPEGAISLASSQPNPAAEMLTEGIRHANESINLVEEVMFESILGAQPKLERFLNLIAVTAATAPLLGLLGTVTGIIKTFKLMEVFGAGDPKPLISGISEALITTELGLILAIPALIVHGLLSRRVREILSQMEKLSVAFVNDLSRQKAGVRTSQV